MLTNIYFFSLFKTIKLLLYYEKGNKNNADNEHANENMYFTFLYFTYFSLL